MANKIYETKQAAMRDCGHEYATHEKSLRGKLVCVYRNPHTDEPCYCDQFTITMKKVRTVQRSQPDGAGKPTFRKVFLEVNERTSDVGITHDTLGFRGLWRNWQTRTA